MWNLKKKKLIETEIRLVVDRRWGVRELGEDGQKVQTLSYKINKFWNKF